MALTDFTVERALNAWFLYLVRGLEFDANERLLPVDIDYEISGKIYWSGIPPFDIPNFVHLEAALEIIEEDLDERNDPRPRPRLEIAFAPVQPSQLGLAANLRNSRRFVYQITMVTDERAGFTPDGLVRLSFWLEDQDSIDAFDAIKSDDQVTIGMEYKVYRAARLWECRPNIGVLVFKDDDYDPDHFGGHAVRHGGSEIATLHGKSSSGVSQIRRFRDPIDEFDDEAGRDAALGSTDYVQFVEDRKLAIIIDGQGDPGDSGYVPAEIQTYEGMRSGFMVSEMQDMGETTLMIDRGAAVFAFQDNDYVGSDFTVAGSSTKYTITGSTGKSEPNTDAVEITFSPALTDSASDNAELMPDFTQWHTEDPDTDTDAGGYWTSVKADGDDEFRIAERNASRIAAHFAAGLHLEVERVNDGDANDPDMRLKVYEQDEPEPFANLPEPDGEEFSRKVMYIESRSQTGPGFNVGAEWRMPVRVFARTFET